jgi:hypothetical protein
MRSDLDARLLAAHAKGDRAALIALYLEASETSEVAVAQRFYLTHAYVYALEAGSDEAPALRAKLVELGAETPE